MSGWHFVYTLVSYSAQVASYVKLPLKQVHWCSWCCKSTNYEKFAFCLLQELLMRCSALNLVDSGDSPWGRLHGHIQTICTFDSSYSRADIKWQLSVSYVTLSCLQNVKGLSLNPKLHQIALVPQKTHGQALILFIESYIGSFEATINSDFIQICL